MPRVSVICIARSDEEFGELRRRLSRQTFRDYELVTSTARSIPRAWNECLAKARGEVLVFTESDAYPLDDTWLEEIVQRVREGVVLKGLEINPTDLNMCNLAAHRKTLADLRFDESFPIAEDTEFFVRLKALGIELKQVEGFPVIHVPSVSVRKTIMRSFLSGRLMAKILVGSGSSGVLTVNDRFPRQNYIHPVVNRLRIILGNALFLLGLALGMVGYTIAAKILRATGPQGEGRLEPRGPPDSSTGDADPQANHAASQRRDG